MKRESRQEFDEWDEEESGFSLRTVIAVLAASKHSSAKQKVALLTESVD